MRRIFESECFYLVEDSGNAVERIVRDERLHKRAHFLVGDLIIEIREVVRQDRVEQEPADGSLEGLPLERSVFLVLRW